MSFGWIFHFGVSLMFLGNHPRHSLWWNLNSTHLGMLVFSTLKAVWAPQPDYGWKGWVIWGGVARQEHQKRKMKRRMDQSTWCWIGACYHHRAPLGLWCQPQDTGRRAGKQRGETDEKEVELEVGNHRGNDKGDLQRWPTDGCWKLQDVSEDVLESYKSGYPLSIELYLWTEEATKWESVIFKMGAGRWMGAVWPQRALTPIKHWKSVLITKMN